MKNWLKPPRACSLLLTLSAAAASAAPCDGEQAAVAKAMKLWTGGQPQAAADSLKPLAAANCAGALKATGDIIFFGNIYTGEKPAPDPRAGLKYYLAAEKSGETEGVMAVAQAYGMGFGSLSRDVFEARRRWRALAEKGNEKAQVSLGRSYRLDKPQELEQSFKNFAASAQQGNLYGIIMTAHAYFTGEGVARDRAKAVFWLKKAAERDSMSAYNLALLHLPESLTQNDFSARAEDLCRQAQAGNDTARAIFIKSAGAKTDYEGSAGWVCAPALKGNTYAREMASYLLNPENGIGHYASVRNWVAEQGKSSKAAKRWLEAMPEAGGGNIPDFNEGLGWLKKASSAGVERAQLMLADCALGANPPDYKLAADTLRQPAERGVPEAQYRLALLNATGKGTRKDLVNAMKWLLAARENPDLRESEIQNAINLLVPILSPSDKGKARKQADALLAAQRARKHQHQEPPPDAPAR